MDRKRVLLLGSGQCGNRLTSLLLQKDGRYTGIFCNASMSDMEKLPKLDINRNVFYIPNATGTGKNPELASRYIKEEVQKLIDMILKYPLQETIVFLLSADGGFGNGSLKPTTMAIKHAIKQGIMPEKSINVVGVLPNLNEGKVAFKNTIRFWNDLIYLKNNGLIDSIQFIDNNKRKTLEEINECAVEELDYILGFQADTIDENDSKRINIEKGYKFLMKLDEKYRSIDVAIDNAIKQSVFVEPANYDCKYLGISVKKEDFYAEDFKNKFDTLEAPYCGYNDQENLVILSGLSMPKEPIEMIEMALKDAETKEKERMIEDKEDLFIHVDGDENKNIKKETNNHIKKEVKSTVSSKELNNLFDENFWDE